MPDHPPAQSDATLVHALRSLLAERTGAPVALKETHISWVLLTPRMAFKLKKPVQLPFLDFSTPERRHRFCEEELRLNRRLAPALYRAVLAVRGHPVSPHFGGDDEPVDWLLCMKRFPDGALLSERMAAGRLRPQELERLALRLADFHRTAPVAAAGGRFGTPERIEGAVRAVLEQLASRGALPPEVDAWVEEQARRLAPVWRERLAAGFVREGHGDLHLANAVALDGEVTAFDCIEFDPALRWIDSMSDIAFLTMDLHARGRPDLAWRFLDAYLQAGGDYRGLAVLRFYEVYRALVRALVAGIAREGGGARGDGPDYLRCAARLIAQARRRPRLAILFGLSGSGKSTLALELVQAAGAVRVRSDAERKRLFGLPATQRGAPGGVDLYTPQATRATYARLASCAREALRAGYAVIVDAAFLRREEREAFEALAREMAVAFSVFACEAEPAVLRRRVAARAAAGADVSDADLAVLEQQLRHHEPLTDRERGHAVVVATDGPVDVEALARQWRWD
ncbi:AAA family ATPase [Caldimonas aquatica]|uniref:AAA family ATPase n=1 Tax=Caldimonas aquatica TaxID=376175 RepID=A0ABY6MM64_9BURK|nr:bifunctional aminoglycoside phosphotransferase/ATP-binding protein [Schlegelella aquatica]UZD53599.1 AAA family ATPase [Schlegelella aquatica]